MADLGVSQGSDHSSGDVRPGIGGVNEFVDGFVHSWHNNVNGCSAEVNTRFAIYLIEEFGESFGVKPVLG
jgi:hypothetical protein